MSAATMTDHDDRVCHCGLGIEAHYYGGPAEHSFVPVEPEPHPTTNDHDALLAAVLADPEDDAPRLVLADWFTENGQEARGELIRVQCRLAEIGFADGCPKCKDYGGPCNTCEFGEPDDLLRRQLYAWSYLVRDAYDNHAGVLSGLPAEECTVRTGKSPDRYPHTCYAIRRGFVDTIYATLAGFMGGPCGRCGHRGLVGGGPTPAEECPDCSGSGRTPGAVGVFAREPVTNVVLTDREPNEWTTEDGSNIYVWVCPTSNQQPIPADSPRKLFNQLEGGYLHRDNWARRYDTRDAALEALSRAATNYGRVAAGLSPLPPTPGVAA